MNTKTLKKSYLLILCSLMMSITVLAQGNKEQRVSPATIAKGTINGAAVTINYGSPAVKGRKIWGELVPYNKTWRAGANEATTFESNKPLKIQGKTLPAGKYSLYVVPGEKEWKIIFNSETGQWGIKRTGETTDDATKDVLTVIARPVKSPKMNERLVYSIAKNGFAISWEHLTVPVIFK